jgi:hypothetical protein
VSRASTVTGISSSTNPSLFGEPVTFIATVFIKAPGGGTPLGTVTFFDGTTILSTSGLNIHNEAFFSTASLAAGNHPITAVYSGDIHFLGSTSFIEVQKVIPHISNGLAAVGQLAGVQATGALPVNETIVVTTPANTIDRDAAWRAAHLDEVFAAAHSVPHREVRRNAHLRTASVGDDWLEV